MKKSKITKKCSHANKNKKNVQSRQREKFDWFNKKNFKHIKNMS